MNIRPHDLRAHALDTLRQAARVCLDLYKVMIPIIIIVKILEELDLIRYLALPLAPLMELVGLPAKMGLVWATAMATNLYSSMIVYATLVAGATGVASGAAVEPLSVAQVTVLCVMLLVAHNLPVEIRIAQHCGANPWGQLTIRILGALVYGLLLHLFLERFDLLRGPSRLLFAAPPQSADLWAWAWGQTRNLISLFFVVLALMTLMKILNLLRVTKAVVYLLSPLLRFMGVGKSAATITVIGLCLGIAYGGGLILNEVRSGRVATRDVFASLSLMGLSHALIEDTLLMLMLGGHMLGTLWGRLLFSLAAMALLSRLHDRFVSGPQAPALATVKVSNGAGTSVGD